MAFVNSPPLNVRDLEKTFCIVTPRRRTLSIKRTPTRAVNRRSDIITARSWVDPSDEAFVTCGNCGSDEIVSATKLIERGTMKVKCSQCGNKWVANVSTALTIDGDLLLSQYKSSRLGKDEREGGNGKIDENKLPVKLYISGLGPKIDNAALRRAVEVYGQVQSCSVVYDRVTRRSRGFGFITVIGKTAATAIIDELSGSTILGGWKLSVREAIE